MLTLFHGWRSSASRRVRLCLAEKGLDFESRTVDLAKMEHHKPEFLKLNPNGVIPLLILDDGRSLYESGTICEYLDETHPEPPLRPDDAYGRAMMRNWIRHVDERIINLIIFNWAHSLAKTAQTWSDAELAEKLKKRAEQGAAGGLDPRRAQTLYRGGARRGARQARADARQDGGDAAWGAWLLGDRYTIADIAVVPFIKRIDEEIAPDEVTEAKHPRVFAWWTAIQARPAFTVAKIGSFTDD